MADQERLAKYEREQRNILRRARDRMIAVADRLAGAIADVEARSDLEQPAKRRLIEELRREAEPQLAAVRDEIERAAAEGAAALRAVRRFDSWDSSREMAMAAATQRWSAAIAARTSGANGKREALESVVEAIAQDAGRDDDTASVLALRRLYPSLAMQHGRTASAHTMDFLDIQASLTTGYGWLGRAVALEGELEMGRRMLGTAAGLIHAEIVEGRDASVVPGFGGPKDLAYRYGVAPGAEPGSVIAPTAREAVGSAAGVES